MIVVVGIIFGLGGICSLLICGLSCCLCFCGCSAFYRRDDTLSLGTLRWRTRRNTLLIVVVSVLGYANALYFLWSSPIGLCAVVGLAASVGGNTALLCGPRRFLKQAGTAILVSVGARLVCAFALFTFRFPGSTRHDVAVLNLLVVCLEPCVGAWTHWMRQRLHELDDDLEKKEKKKRKRQAALALEDAAEGQANAGADPTGGDAADKQANTDEAIDAALVKEQAALAKQQKHRRYYCAHNPNLPTPVNEAKRAALYVGLYSLLLVMTASLLFLQAHYWEGPAAYYYDLYYYGDALEPEATRNWPPVKVTPIVAYGSGLLALIITVAIVYCGPVAAGQHHEKDGPRFARQHRRAGWLAVGSLLCLAYVLIGGLLQVVRDAWNLDWYHYAFEGNQASRLLILVSVVVVILTIINCAWHVLFVRAAFRAAESLADVPEV